MNTYTSLRRSLTFVSALLLSVTLLQAGDDKEIVSERIVEAKDWSVELGTGVLFSNVRSSNLDSYTMIPAKASAILRIDEDSLDNVLCGVLRGHTDFLFGGFGYGITNGPESRIVGINVGPRYNFVQPGWKIVPYIQGLVGIGFADSSAATVPAPQRGLGQDFNFMFGVSFGAKYLINDDWYVGLSANYTHFSNSGLSEPAHLNRAIDAAGPEISVGTTF